MVTKKIHPVYRVSFVTKCKPCCSRRKIGMNVYSGRGRLNLHDPTTSLNCIKLPTPTLSRVRPSPNLIQIHRAHDEMNPTWLYAANHLTISTPTLLPQKLSLKLIIVFEKTRNWPGIIWNRRVDVGPQQVISCKWKRYSAIYMFHLYKKHNELCKQLDDLELALRQREHHGSNENRGECDQILLERSFAKKFTLT